MDDLISRQAAINAVHEEFDGCLVWDESGMTMANEVERILDSVPPAQPERKTGKWIPFKTRLLTDEEREEHPEWDCIIVGPIPEDGQRMLVSINLKGHEEVQYDEFYSDDGSYLDSGYEIGSEAVAWMPLPKPYREEK